MLLVASPRVGVVVYPGVPGELVGAAEAFRASGESAGVRLLSSVGPDVAGLVLETVEGLLTQRALVRARKVLAGVLLGRLCVLQEGSHEAHCGSRHGGLGGDGRVGGGSKEGGRSRLLRAVGGSVVVEYAGEVAKTYGRG